MPYPLYSHAKYLKEIPEENSESEQSENEELDIPTITPVHSNGNSHIVPAPDEETLSEDEDSDHQAVTIENLNNTIGSIVPRQERPC